MTFVEEVQLNPLFNWKETQSGDLDWKIQLASLLANKTLQEKVGHAHHACN